MPDFTARGSFGRYQTVLSSFGESGLCEYVRTNGSNISAQAWTTANTAIYYPVMVTWPFLAQKIGVQVTTQSGNMDVGIYDEKGNLLVSMGSTAVAAAGLQSFDIADTWLNPGTYFVGMNVDNTTAAFNGFSVAAIPAPMARVCGVQQEAVGAVTLPNPATFATFTTRTLHGIIVTGATL